MTSMQHKKQNTLPTSVGTFSCHAVSRQRNTSAADHTLSAKPFIFIMQNQHYRSAMPQEAVNN